MALVSAVCPIINLDEIKINRAYICEGDCYVYSHREIEYIVIHYTGNKKDSALANAKYFYSNRGRCGASAHYFVDDSEIYQSKALCNAAWHCGGASVYKHKYCRNSNSIGIEMACTAGNYAVSKKTIDNAARLCARLCILLGFEAKEVDKRVLRHYDVWDKECPAQWAEKNSSGWKEFKSRVIEYINGDDITMTKYEELKNEIAKLKEKTDWIKDMPDWAKPTIEKLYNKNYLQGDENGALGLSEDMMRLLVVLDRAGVI